MADAPRRELKNALVAVPGIRFFSFWRTSTLMGEQDEGRAHLWQCSEVKQPNVCRRAVPAVGTVYEHLDCLFLRRNESAGRRPAGLHVGEVKRVEHRPENIAFRTERVRSE